MDNPQNGTLPDIYPLVSDELSEEDFKELLNEKRQVTGNLFDDNIISYLILVKFGKNPVNINQLTDLETGKKVSVNVTVSEVEVPREFTRKDGNVGRVVNMTVEDLSGSCSVVLWDTAHHKLIEEKGIGKGTELLMVNVRVKQTDFGLELNPGKKSMLKILNTEQKKYWDWLMARKYVQISKSPDNKLTNLTDLQNSTPLEHINIKGTITNSGTLREFKRQSGEAGSVLNLSIYDGTAKAQVILWDSAALENQDLKIGDMLLIENAKIKYRDDLIEIHSDYRTKIKRLDND